MGEMAENIVEQWEISREEQDDYAYATQQKYNLAPDPGGFKVELAPVTPPRPSDLSLRKPCIYPPSSLAAICVSEDHAREGNTYGRSFRDRIRAFKLDFPNPPDVVARPRNEQEVEAVLEWCSSSGYAAIPFGGGSSTVAGFEPPEGYDGIVTIDMEGLGQVLEIDDVSRSARIQGGVYGPALEDQLRPHGFTLRHYPQSFEFSTLGGWIATRSGGHYATNQTHIDDMVESVRMVTPSGLWESRRLPGSGAGPSPDRIAIGSEGILGIITEAWMRIQARPVFRASAGVTFPTFTTGAEAARRIVQTKMWPANRRLLDPLEAAAAAARHIIVVAVHVARVAAAAARAAVPWGARGAASAAAVVPAAAVAVAAALLVEIANKEFTGKLTKLNLEFRFVAGVKVRRPYFISQTPPYTFYL